MSDISFRCFGDTFHSLGDIIDHHWKVHPQAQRRIFNSRRRRSRKCNGSRHGCGAWSDGPSRSKKKRMVHLVHQLPSLE